MLSGTSMNFNIYLEDELGQKLQNLCQLTGKKRNTVIREALLSWLSQYPMVEWPESIQNFDGDAELVPFESYRTELLPPNDYDLF
jgi:hypothetical protein